MKTIDNNRIDPQTEAPAIRWWNRLLRLIVAVAIIAAGTAGAIYLKQSAPRTQKRAPQKYIPVVQAQTLMPASHRIVVKAMGVVVPARNVVLRSRVAGQIVSMHPEFVEGGFIPQGVKVLQLDTVDYELALAQRKSDLVNSQYALKLEMGRQKVAQREWELLNRERTDPAVESDLALRRPHLDKVRADVGAAQAAVDKAALDLSRTRINAPFNAIVRSKSVDIGSHISSQEPLAELIGTDAYWVQASIPVDRISWINIPRNNGDQGSKAKIYYASSNMAEGRVIRLMGDLDSEGRMARVLIEVKDPLRRQAETDQEAPLLISEYVRVEIEGRQLENVLVIPRSALRDNDTLWLINPDNTLTLKSVSPLWRDTTTVVLQEALGPDKRLILSELALPIEGMQLRLETPSPTVGQETGPQTPTGDQGDGRS